MNLLYRRNALSVIISVSWEVTAALTGAVCLFSIVGVLSNYRFRILSIKTIIMQILKWTFQRARISEKALSALTT